MNCTYTLLMIILKRVSFAINSVMFQSYSPSEWEDSLQWLTAVLTDGFCLSSILLFAFQSNAPSLTLSLGIGVFIEQSIGKQRKAFSLLTTLEQLRVAIAASGILVILLYWHIHDWIKMLIGSVAKVFYASTIKLKIIHVQ